MTAHCQICEREIKDKTGVIAHHGYHRQGGWQTDSCVGARELPYEKSRDAIPKAIKTIENFVGLKRAEIVEVKKGKTAVPFFRGNVKPSHPTYKIRQEEYLNKLESEISMAERDKDKLQKRFAKWVENADKTGENKNGNN